MRAAIVTVSDRVSRGESDNHSGPAAVDALESLGFEVSVCRVVPDGIDSVELVLTELVGMVDLVVTTGGTGFTQRDLTPEATLRVVEREAPGLAEAMRSATFGVNPHGMLSRGVAGIAGSTLIINLPGSVGGVRDSLEAISLALRHGVELLRNPLSGHNSPLSS